MIASAPAWCATCCPKMGWKLRWTGHIVLQLIKCFRSKKQASLHHSGLCRMDSLFFFLWKIPFAVQAKTRRETFLTLRVWHKPTKLNSQGWSKAGFTVLKQLHFVLSLMVQLQTGKTLQAARKQARTDSIAFTCSEVCAGQGHMVLNTLQIKSKCQYLPWWVYI